jgi:hypothetical protein
VAVCQFTVNGCTCMGRSSWRGDKTSGHHRLCPLCACIALRKLGLFRCQLLTALNPKLSGCAGVQAHKWAFRPQPRHFGAGLTGHRRTAEEVHVQKVRQQVQAERVAGVIARGRGGAPPCAYTLRELSARLRRHSQPERITGYTIGGAENAAAASTVGR